QVLRDPGHQFVVATGDARVWDVVQVEAVAARLEGRDVGQRPLGELPELPTDAVQADLGLVEAELQLVVDVRVEVVKQGLPRPRVAFLDDLVHLGPQLVESRLNGRWRATGTEGAVQAGLEAHPALDGPKDLVGGAEDAVEEL